MHTIGSISFLEGRDSLEQTGIDRRRHRRVEFREPVQYQLPSQNNYGGCLAADISAGGIRINFNDFVPLNAELVFQVFLNAVKSIRCVGRVVWVQKFPFSDRYQVGVQFRDDDATQESKKAIHQFIESR